MLLVRDVMSYACVSVPHAATVRDAVENLRDHPAELVLVLRDDAVVGLVDALTLSLYEGEVSVQEAMEPPPFLLEPLTTLGEAAKLLRTHKLRLAPVVDQGRLVGVLSERDLLCAWGEPNDGLTGLPVQHRLRRWLSNHLAAGKEVAVLFLDLNNFGQLNKTSGHVYGDRVLQSVGTVLRDVVDRRRDFICRYGGDEFAIGTIRSLEEAEELASECRDRIAAVELQGKPVGLRVAIGVSGGRRSQIRPGTHPDATLDDLITRASAASTAAKELSEGISSTKNVAMTPGWEHVERIETAPVPVSGSLRPLVDGYSVVENNGEVEVTVRLGSGHELVARTCRAAANGLPRAVAAATAQCLRAYARTAVDIQVEETYEYTTPRGLLCVGATILLVRDDGATERLIGTAPVLGDVCRTYINAVLDATNRRMQRALVAQRAVMHVTVS